MNLRQSVAAIGSLYRVTPSGNREYVGTCFSIIDASVFITAGHCVASSDIDCLWVNHFGAGEQDCFSRAREVHMIAEADLAIIRTDAPEARWACPFGEVQYAADYGEEVYAIGHPDLFSADLTQRSLRFFRGIIQRPFIHEPPRRKPYSAFELSFACPLGLSGGPVILANAPNVVLGVVTGNYETFTVIDIAQSDGATSLIETRRIISSALPRISSARLRS
jgi:hypothetical protein